MLGGPDLGDGEDLPRGIDQVSRYPLRGPAHPLRWHSDHGSAPHPRRINRITPQMGGARCGRSGRAGPRGLFGLDAPHASRSTTSSPSTTTTAAAPRLSRRVPSPGTPVPGGGPVPQRPALAVKIDNYPGGPAPERVDKADVVFDEPVEGGSPACRRVPVPGPPAGRADPFGPQRRHRDPRPAGAAHAGPRGGDQSGARATHCRSTLIDFDLRTHGSIMQHVAGPRRPLRHLHSRRRRWGLEPDDTTPPSHVVHLLHHRADGHAGHLHPHPVLGNVQRHVDSRTRPPDTSCAPTAAPPHRLPTAARTARPTSWSSTCTSPTGPGSRTVRAGSRSGGAVPRPAARRGAPQWGRDHRDVETLPRSDRTQSSTARRVAPSPWSPGRRGWSWCRPP